MFYTYVLKQIGKNHFYTGITNNLRKRLEKHNNGENISTRGKAWEIYCYFAFPTRKIDENFEKYLKTSSGRSFAKNIFPVTAKNLSSTLHPTPFLPLKQSAHPPS